MLKFIGMAFSQRRLFSLRGMGRSNFGLDSGFAGLASILRSIIYRQCLGLIGISLRVVEDS